MRIIVSSAHSRALKQNNNAHERGLLEYILHLYTRLTAKDDDIKQANATAQRALVPTRSGIFTNGLSTPPLLASLLHADEGTSTFVLFVLWVGIRLISSAYR